MRKETPIPLDLRRLGVPRGAGRGPRQQLPAILQQRAAMPRLWVRFRRNRTLSVSNWTVSGTSFPRPFLTLSRHSRVFLPKTPVSPNLPSYFPYPVNCLLPVSLRNLSRRSVFFEPCKVGLRKPVAPFTFFVIGKPVSSILQTWQADFRLVAGLCSFLVDFWGGGGATGGILANP